MQKIVKFICSRKTIYIPTGNCKDKIPLNIKTLAATFLSITREILYVYYRMIFFN